MPSGETLLKFTDYPFAYSFIAIMSGIMGFSIGENQLVFLGIAGAFGTFLTIIDPLGGLLRRNTKNIIHKTYEKKGKLKSLEEEYKISALKSKSITYEIEKIIGLFYFVLIIILFMVVVSTPTVFYEKLIIYDNNNEPICSDLCFKTGYLTLSGIALIILGIKATGFWKEIDEKIEIAGFHQIAINDDNATQTSVESMTRAVEQNDWALARLWCDKIRDEIKYKKGKRELIIKSADLVYSPLHKETIDFENKLNQSPPLGRYSSFVHDEWDKIKLYSHQSIIDDSELRHRIDSFYNLMYDYNEQRGTTNKEIEKIINKHVSNEFGGNISRVGYEVRIDNVNNGVDLIGCVLAKIHPLNVNEKKGTMSSLDLTTNNQVNRIDTPQGSQKFDNVWPTIISDVHANPEVQKIQRMYSELKIENSKLRKIYSEKIGMQWNV